MAGLRWKSVFITGASRGIGLEFVRQLVELPEPPKFIFATCRKPETAKELQELASTNSRIHIHQFDVLDYTVYPKLVEWVQNVLGGEGLTALVNNAAVTVPESALDVVTRDNMMHVLESNAVAPLMISKAFLPLLKKSAAASGSADMSSSRAIIVNISTMMASIADNSSGGIYPYRASKAALNMINKSLSVDLKADGILAIALHPGWVLTDMGGKNALIDTQKSVQGMLHVLEELSDKDTGCFVNYKGDRIPW
jgi:NAD(P)-dependent dehydrogenase (short-subunit alcohol dehydrogenase family)